MAFKVTLSVADPTLYIIDGKPELLKRHGTVTVPNCGVETIPNPKITSPTLSVDPNG